ncbi:MAG TPA: amidohydrolase [Vicinamibacterales bacterium]|nr:amidohydrolase [Vicinamibacterales bacterium]
MRRSALVVVVVAAACGGGSPAPADLVFRGGAIRTMEPARPTAEAVAVRDGRIVHVGTAAEAARLVGPATEVVDLAGRLLLPGFHDTHVHPVSGGIELGECDLNPAGTLADLERIIAACVAREPDAAWLRGGGFQLTLFADGAPPRDLLDRLAPDRPAFLSSADGHTGWANSRALEVAGVTRDTPNPPPDGLIVRRADGEAQGTLREAAMGLVTRQMPEHADAQMRAGLERALAMAASFGITTLHEANAGERSLRAYRAVEDAGGLTARVIVALSTDAARGADQVADLVALRERHRGRLVQPVAAKLFVDGVIEGGTAALLEPYVDRPTFQGELRWPPEVLTATVRALDAAGFKVHLHAIGDRAIQVSLDALEAARAQDGGAGPRHVLAHIQLFDPADIPRFASLGAVASFQPLWAYADTYITQLTEPRLGPARSRWLYPIRSVVATGAIVSAGSDWSVTTMDPLPAIEVGVTRRDPDAAAGDAWLPDERVDLETMIRLYTTGGAMAGDLEEVTGSITPGKSADLIVLDRNLFEIPPTAISDARVLMTVFEGRVVYRRE